MSFRSALSNPGFRKLWASQAISNLGDSIHEIALIWIVYEVTGNPALISATVVASLFPMVFTSLPAGVFVDRWDRKRLLAGTAFLRGIAVLAIPFVGNYYPQYLVPTVVGVAFVTGVLQAFFSPTKTAVIPKLVSDDDLDSANSLTEMTQSFSKFLYALGGILVAYFGSYVAFYVDATSFFVAALVLITLPESIRYSGDGEESSSGLENVYSEMTDGLSFIRNSPLMLSLLLLSILTGFALGPLGIVLPVFAKRSLHTGSATFGYLYASIYVGALVGGIVVESFDALVDAARGRVIVGGVIGMGVAILSLLGSLRFTGTPVLTSVLGMLVFGVCLAVVQIPVRTLAQSFVPDDLQGRVFSVWTAVGLVSPPVSVAIVGLGLSKISVQQVVFIQGSTTIAVGLLLGTTVLYNVDERAKTDSADEVVES